MEVRREKLRALCAARGAAHRPRSFASASFAPATCCAATSRAPTLERHVTESVLTTTLEKAMRWGRANSIFPATFGLACCAIEMMSIVSPRYDVARFGAENMRASPRQADMLILSGRVAIKMAPVIRRLYDQMLEPKWVIAMGACSSSGGMFANYAVVQGADKFMPVDIHVPGCPPRPEALLYGFNKLQRMILGNPDPGLAAPLQRGRHRGVGPARDRLSVEGGGRGVRRRQGALGRPTTPSWPGKAADARRPRPRADRPGPERRPPRARCSAPTTSTGRPA